MDGVGKKDPKMTTIINTLFAFQYVNMTTNPLLLGPAMKLLLSSPHDLTRVANKTGLNLNVVRHIIIDIYACVNTTSYLGGQPMKTCFAVGESTLSAAIKECLDIRANTNALVLLVVGVFSFGFLMAGSFINRRRSACVNCCHGRPAPVVPLNMLDSYENRFGNALAFGVTTSYCLNVVFESSKNVMGTRVGEALENVPSSVSLVFKVVAAFVISNAVYPLFVCMRTKYKVIGSLFGIFYSSAWLMLLTLKFYLTHHGCLSKLPAETEVLQLFEGLAEIPQFVCMILLLIRFITVLLKTWKISSKKWNKRRGSSLGEFQEEYLILHVENLLKAVKKTRRKFKKESLKVKIREKVYSWKPEFRYSTRVVAAFMVSGIAIYIVTVRLLCLVWYLDLLLQEFVTTYNFQLIIQKYLSNSETILIRIRKHLSIWIVCMYVAIALAALKTFIVFLNMLSWYRGHIIRLRKGDKSWLPASMKSLKASSTSLMAAGMKYAGYQVAYIAWGFIVFATTLLLILGILASFIIYPLSQGETSYLLLLIYEGLPAIALSIVVYIFQILSAKFAFLQDRGARIFVNNRSAFHITSYYMFFFNIFLGLFSCLMRIIKGVGIGIVFLERVQKSLLPRSFEKMDPGYFAYIGYILVEHSHANPVLCVFFHLLQEEFKSVKKNRESIALLLDRDFELSNFKSSNELGGFESNKKKKGEVEMDDEKRNTRLISPFERQKIIRNRWSLFYTLVNNPDLVKYRRNKGDDLEDEMENAEDLEETGQGNSAFYD